MIFFFKFVFISFFCFLNVSNSFAKTEVFLLKTYDGSQDVIGWLMSEKLDGIRAVWDGKQLRTKNGNLIHAPKSFLKGFPDFALDGELWTKRNDFETIQSIVLRKQPDHRWKNIYYHIFELPNQQGNLLERLNILDQFLQQHSNIPIRIIPQLTIQSTQHLKEQLSKIIALKGEGLVVRNPNLAYHTGRSAQDLKVKQTQDAECKVVGYKEGKGKFAGLIGSIICELNNGNIINIGTGLSMKERKKPPRKGSYITFKYYGHTNHGKPRFPVYLRKRLAE